MVPSFALSISIAHGDLRFEFDGVYFVIFPVLGSSLEKPVFKVEIHKFPWLSSSIPVTSEPPMLFGFSVLYWICLKDFFHLDHLETPLSVAIQIFPELSSNMSSTRLPDKLFLSLLLNWKFLTRFFLLLKTKTPSDSVANQIFPWISSCKWIKKFSVKTFLTDV